MKEVETFVREVMAKRSLIRLVLSDPRNRNAEEVRRVVVQPVLLRGETRYQFEFHTARNVTHHNLTPDEAADHILALLTDTFRQAQFYTADADVQIAVSPNRKPTITKRPPSRQPTAPRHDRRKNTILPDDQRLDFLVRLGLMSEAGTVIAARYDKFRQINRFLEMVADVVDVLDAGRPLHIVDFGCGKAYLTFALYHYLREIRGFDAAITGVDRKQDVAASVNNIARELNYTGLTFVIGDIQSYTRLEGVDMVVALHACDTATDDALAKAVAWDAKVILAAPCCQHELFKQIDNPLMRPLLKHGIVRERLAALITDCLRAGGLETAGYAVQMLEFVETEHTPKNILIRAVKRAGRPADAERTAEEYRAFRDFWHVTPREPDR